MAGEKIIVPEGLNTTPPPVSEEAQTADRMIGPPPGMTEADMAAGLQRANDAAQARAEASPFTNVVSPGSVNTPPIPPAPLPRFESAGDGLVNGGGSDPGDGDLEEES